MIPMNYGVELNKRLSRYKISTAVAADVVRVQNYIPVTHPLISDRRMRGARKMISSLSLALSLIRLRRNERIREVGGKLSAFSAACAAHSNDASTYAIVGQWCNLKWSIVRGRSRAWHFALRVHLEGPPGRYSRRAQLM